MSKLPKQYAWLEKEPTTKMLTQWIAIYGTQEVPGPNSNPFIIKMAEDMGVDDWYSNDDIPWCGLAMGWVAKQAGKKYPRAFMRALSWITFGSAQKVAMLGDVLVSKRLGGGHVMMYVGEDIEAYHVIGANQRDAISIVRKPKKTIIAIRRPEYPKGQPASVRRRFLSPLGEPAGSEA
jgi:uncharacterized protein (TIGR02594 family)